MGRRQSAEALNQKAELLVEFACSRRLRDGNRVNEDTVQRLIRIRETMLSASAL